MYIKGKVIMNKVMVDPNLCYTFYVSIKVNKSADSSWINARRQIMKIGPLL